MTKATQFNENVLKSVLLPQDDNFTSTCSSSLTISATAPLSFIYRRYMHIIPDTDNSVLLYTSSQYTVVQTSSKARSNKAHVSFNLVELINVEIRHVHVQLLGTDKKQQQQNDNNNKSEIITTLALIQSSGQLNRKSTKKKTQ